MDDKALAKIDALLAQMQQCLAELRAALPILNNLEPPPPRSVGLLPYALRRQVRSATEQFMSGRWRRRAGDVYGNVAQSKQVKDADRPTGDLRPPDQR